MIDLTEAKLNLTSSTMMPILGIDLDGCVDEAPVFFQLLTAYWPGKVVVITFRDDRAKAETVLKDFQIRYDAIVLVDTFEAKAEVIVELGVHTYFDDQPEMLRDIQPDVAVFLVRNEGNFDFDDRRWMFSDRTGKLV